MNENKYEENNQIEKETDIITDLSKKEAKIIVGIAAIVGVVLIIINSSGILKSLPGFKSSFDFEVKPSSEVVTEATTVTEPEVTTTEATTTTVAETTTEITTTTSAGPTGHIIITVRNDDGSTTEYDVKSLSTSRATNVRKVAYNDVEIHEITENEITFTFVTIDGDTRSIIANQSDVTIEVF